MKSLKKFIIEILSVCLLLIIQACDKPDNSNYITGSCFGKLVGSYEEISSVRSLGSEWIRPHPGPYTWQWIESSTGKFDWSLTDKWAKEAQKHDISILGTIWPYADWDQISCHSSSCEVNESDEFYPKELSESYIMNNKQHSIPKYRCVPCNFDDYKNFLTRLVERYDGDGNDDMPGLSKPILYWEILNEPEMESNNLTFFMGSQEEYLQILQVSYEAIKAACPDCKVLHGGGAGMMHVTLSYWEYIFDLGGGEYFDIANIHFLGAGDGANLNVKDFKNLLDQKGLIKPIWVTEAQFPSKNDMLSSIKGAMEAGATKIFNVGHDSYSDVLASEPSICK